MEEKGLVKKMLPYLPGVGMGIAGTLGFIVSGTLVKEVTDSLDLMYNALNHPGNHELVEQAKNIYWPAVCKATGILLTSVGSAGAFALGGVELYSTQLKKNSENLNNSGKVSDLKI